MQSLTSRVAHFQIEVGVAAPAQSHFDARAKPDQARINDFFRRDCCVRSERQTQVKCGIGYGAAGREIDKDMVASTR